MNKSCVICHNSKPINHTNRLVTEDCGHVKCMDCLMHEKTGCRACVEHSDTVYLEVPPDQDDPSSEPTIALLQVVEEVNASGDAQTNITEESSKKIKPETSHIKIETDTNGRHYVCTVCKKKFNARSHVAYHAYCNGQRKPYQCPECDKSFATHSHFKYHMRVHRNERTYACDVCGDSFFQMSKLQRHKLKHTTEKKYVCNECNKAFNNVSSLRKHSLIHTEVKPYSCPTCNRRFRDSSNLKKHIAKHEESWWSCGVCGRAVRSLAAHARAHHARRAHVCPRCPQAFHSRKDMRRHVAVHTDSKPFRCKVCNRRFRRKDNLERHIRNTHPNHTPAAAVDCDENALKQLNANGNDAPRDNQAERAEKTKLEIMNPLPPLPQEVIQKHICSENTDNEKDQEIEKNDKSYILEANHARQSVIFGPVKKDSKVERKPSPRPEYEYVHKIRKAHFALSHKDSVPLPPVDESKMLELQQKTSLNTLDIRTPPKNMELYKKILYERSDKDEVIDDSSKQNASHEMHWRRKMKLNNTLIL